MSEFTTTEVYTIKDKYGNRIGTEKNFPMQKKNFYFVGSDTSIERIVEVEKVNPESFWCSACDCDVAVVKISLNTRTGWEPLYLCASHTLELFEQMTKICE